MVHGGPAAMNMNTGGIPQPMSTDNNAPMAAGVNQYMAQQSLVQQVGLSGAVLQHHPGSAPVTINNQPVRCGSLAQGGVEGGNDVQQSVMNVVKQFNSNEGVDVKTVTQRLNPRFTEAQVRYVPGPGLSARGVRLFSERLLLCWQGCLGVAQRGRSRLFHH